MRSERETESQFNSAGVRCPVAHVVYANSSLEKQSLGNA